SSLASSCSNSPSTPHIYTLSLHDALPICCAISNTVQVLIPGTGDAVFYPNPGLFGPQLGDVFVTGSQGKSLYRGATLGVRKRFRDRKSTRLNSSHGSMSYAVFCLKSKNARFVEVMAAETIGLGMGGHVTASHTTDMH